VMCAVPVLEELAEKAAALERARVLSCGGLL